MKMIWNKRGNCAVLFTIAEPRIKAMQFYFLQEKKQKPKSNKKPSLYEGGVWVVSTTCIPLLVCSSIKHQPSGFSGASNIGSKQKGEMELFQL
jgi:hypothetical protein